MRWLPHWPCSLSTSDSSHSTVCFHNAYTHSLCCLTFTTMPHICVADCCDTHDSHSATQSLTHCGWTQWCSHTSSTTNSHSTHTCDCVWPHCCSSCKHNHVQPMGDEWTSCCWQPVTVCDVQWWSVCSTNVRPTRCSWHDPTTHPRHCHPHVAIVMCGLTWLHSTNRNAKCAKSWSKALAVWCHCCWPTGQPVRQWRCVHVTLCADCGRVSSV